MTIIEAINKIDTLKPNSYTQLDKIRWLSDLDGIIKSEIIDTHDGGEEIVFNGYDENTDINTELLVRHPHEDIYIKWLESKIDYANAEYGKYNNSITTYNTAYSVFERYYNRTYMPRSASTTYFGGTTVSRPVYGGGSLSEAQVRVIVDEKANALSADFNDAVNNAVSTFNSGLSELSASNEANKEKILALNEKTEEDKTELQGEIEEKVKRATEWERIGFVIVEPDADGSLPKGVYFSLDSDGKPFKLKRVKAIVLTDTTKGDVYTTGTVSIQMRWNDQPDKWNRATWVDGLPTVENKYAKVVFDIEAVDSVAYATAVADKGLGAYSNPQYATRVQLYGGLGVTLATEWIEQIGVDTYSAHFTEGTKVYVYGVRA